jgi:diguanylate cyclase (GGDEF)-like protein
MTDPAVTFSLLDAARVMARGGSLDDKLAALAAHAAALLAADTAAVLLNDMETDTLLSLDGATALAPVDQAGLLAAVLEDRVPVIGAEVPSGLSAVLPGASSCVLTPLVIEDEDGVAIEGLLVAGWAGASPFAEVPDTLLAVADMTAVAIRQARLRNSAWERSDHADRLLHTDRLTGLANRVTFERMLELEIARATRQGSPLAVVMLDVDGLSGIGERHGVRVAEEVLRHVAAAIADRVRLLDTVARFGDDEFVVIAPGDAGGIVALRLRDAIAELPPIGEVGISVSAAVVHHPGDGATGSELVAAAEAALQRAKSQGPGSVLGVQPAGA